MGNILTNALRQLMVVTIGALCASEAVASHFEFCWLTGSVESLGNTSDDDRTFQFRVTSSKPARKGLAESYDPEDCGRYVGMLIEATLPSTVEVSKGAQLEMIQRLWIDVNGQWWNAWEPTDGWEIHE